MLDDKGIKSREAKISNITPSSGLIIKATSRLFSLKISTSSFTDKYMSITKVLPDYGNIS